MAVTLDSAEYAQTPQRFEPCGCVYCLQHTRQRRRVDWLAVAAMLFIAAAFCWGLAAWIGEIQAVIGAATDRAGSEQEAPLAP